MDDSDYKERLKTSTQFWHYAIQRIDLLIISISGAGIYCVLETIKFVSENKLCSCNIQILKYGGVAFIIAIISNLISQFTGKSANKYDVMWCKAQLSGENTQIEIDKLDKISHRYSIGTNILNICSMISMVIGLLYLIRYFNYQF